MKRETLAATRALLPAKLRFLYYADRESPWLLAHGMGRPHARVAELKAGPLAKLVTRPLVQPVVAASGGVLARADLQAVADADAHGLLELPRPAAAGVVAAFDAPWFDFELTFEDWAIDMDPAFFQLSRFGGNLVVQLGFPSDHAALMGKHLWANARESFEWRNHPIRVDGRPTLAWARVDIEGDCALIEEVQSDWLRNVADELGLMWTDRTTRSRDLRGLQLYEAELKARYGKLWPRAMLFATLWLLVELLDVRDIYMHQPATGAVLKRIDGGRPPVSLYTALPKALGFVPTDQAPPFLKQLRRRDLKQLRKTGAPLFWRLRL